jgi:prevent-host-death family protein
MSKPLTTSAARAQFADLVSRAEYGGERIVVHRRRKPLAAVVPIEDLELLERLDDEVDLADARKAMKEREEHSLGSGEERAESMKSRRYGPKSNQENSHETGGDFGLLPRVPALARKALRRIVPRDRVRISNAIQRVLPKTRILPVARSLLVTKGSGVFASATTELFTRSYSQSWLYWSSKSDIAVRSTAN